LDVIAGGPRHPTDQTGIATENRQKLTTDASSWSFCPWRFWSSRHSSL